MLTRENVKEILGRLGADLCGVASLDRFADAPKGYHPLDVFPRCRSVVAFACRFPVGTLLSPSHVPYTRARNSISAKMDAIALELCIEAEKHQVQCIPIPTVECQWDGESGRMRSIVSLKHAAQAAGLGTIGRHSLLITPEFGSMVWLGAVLCDAELEPDPLKEPICQECGRCVEACPIGALDGPMVDQQACGAYAFGEDREKQIGWQISCHSCRDACPHNLGTMNRF